MKTGLACVAVVWALASGAASGPTAPPSVGAILLFEKSPGNCMAKASGVTIDLDTQGDEVTWLVTSTCGAIQHVKLGMTRVQGSGDYKAVLECPPHVMVKKGTPALVTCKVDEYCGGGTDYAAYGYSVCNKKDVIDDPELRVKGGARDKPCPPEKEPKLKCVG